MLQLLDKLFDLAPPPSNSMYPGPFSNSLYNIGILYCSDNADKRKQTSEQIVNELTSISSLYPYRVNVQEFIGVQDYEKDPIVTKDLIRVNGYIELPLCQYYWLEESFQPFFNKDVFLVIEDSTSTKKYDVTELKCFCSFIGIPIFLVSVEKGKYNIGESLSLREDEPEFQAYKNNINEYLSDLNTVTVDPNYDFESYTLPNNDGKNLAFSEVLTLPVTLLRRIEEFRNDICYSEITHSLSESDKSLYKQEQQWQELQIKKCLGDKVKVNFFDAEGLV